MIASFLHFFFTSFKGMVSVFFFCVGVTIYVAATIIEYVQRRERKKFEEDVLEYFQANEAS